MTQLTYDTDYNRRLVGTLLKSYDTDVNAQQPEFFARLVGGAYPNNGASQPRKGGEFIQPGGYPSYPQLNMIEAREFDDMRSPLHYPYQREAGANGPGEAALKFGGARSDSLIDDIAKMATAGKKGRKGKKMAGVGQYGGSVARSGGVGARSAGSVARSAGSVARSGGVGARSGGALSVRKVWEAVKPYAKKYGKLMIVQAREPLRRALVDVVGEMAANMIVDDLTRLSESALEGLGMCKAMDGGSVFKKIWKAVKPIAKPAAKIGIAALKGPAKMALMSVGVPPAISGALVDEVAKAGTRKIDGMGYKPRSRAAKSQSDNRSKRAALVKQVMKERGMSLPEASKYIKQHGLM